VSSFPNGDGGVVVTVIKNAPHWYQVICSLNGHVLVLSDKIKDSKKNQRILKNPGAIVSLIFPPCSLAERNFVGVRWNKAPKRRCYDPK